MASIVTRTVTPDGNAVYRVVTPGAAGIGLDKPTTNGTDDIAGGEVKVASITVVTTDTHGLFLRLYDHPNPIYTSTVPDFILDFPIGATTLGITKPMDADGVPETFTNLSLAVSFALAAGARNPDETLDSANLVGAATTIYINTVAA